MTSQHSHEVFATQNSCRSNAKPAAGDILVRILYMFGPQTELPKLMNMARNFRLSVGIAFNSHCLREIRPQTDMDVFLLPKVAVSSMS